MSVSVTAASAKKRGRGIACMWYPIGFTVAANPSAAVVKVKSPALAGAADMMPSARSDAPCIIVLHRVTNPPPRYPAESQA